MSQIDKSKTKTQRAKKPRIFDKTFPLRMTNGSYDRAELVAHYLHVPAAQVMRDGIDQYTARVLEEIKTGKR